LALLLGKVPPDIQVDLTVSPEAALADDVTDPQLELAERALLLGVVDEGLTNAVKHGKARTIAVEVAVEPHPSGLGDGFLVVSVRNRGPALKAAPVLSGLSMLKTRAEHHGGDLSLAMVDSETVELRAWIARRARGEVQATTEVMPPEVSTVGRPAGRPGVADEAHAVRREPRLFGLRHHRPTTNSV
jgi:anti-sigma regulatory factor (Ser/Thr protein kinase)